MTETPRATVASSPAAPNGNAIHKLCFAGTPIITRTGTEAVRAQLDALAAAINVPIAARVDTLERALRDLLRGPINGVPLGEWDDQAVRAARAALGDA